MRASILVAPETSEVKEIATEKPGPDEVVVRVKACGVCASELHRWETGGDTGFPQRLGHEPSGVIEVLGDHVKTVEFGQRVAAVAPGSGAFAENIIVPEGQVVPIPAGLPFRHALGEPLACLVSGLERTRVNLADRAAVVGCGFMGLALIQLLKRRGVCHLMAIDVREEALQSALLLGADSAFLPVDVQPEDKALGMAHVGQGVDVVFETTGVQAGLTLAGELAAVHGVLSIVGWHRSGLREVDVGLWNWKALEVINAHERRIDNIVRCMRVGLKAAAAGMVDMEALVTHCYALDRVDDAFSAMRQKPAGFVKAVVEPS